MIFGLYIEAYQLEDNEQYILEVHFQVADKFVGGIGKEALQAAEESVVIALTHFADKHLNFKRRFHLIRICIERQQETNKTFFYFTIRET